MSSNGSYYPTVEIWTVEAEQAARGHVFASRMPAAALLMGQCSLTATEAVAALGESIAEYRRDGFSWGYVAALIKVPVPVAMAWAVEGRTRSALAALIRPFRSGSASE